MAGGQPVSMRNMQEVYAYCSEIGIPVFFDATRAVENAYFIQKRDPHYHATHIKDILREMMVYGDGFTISGKKDFLVNIEGVLAFKDNAEWKRKADALLRVHEGRGGRRAGARRPRRDGARGDRDARRPLHPHARGAGGVPGPVIDRSGESPS